MPPTLQCLNAGYLSWTIVIYFPLSAFSIISFRVTCLACCCHPLYFAIDSYRYSQLCKNLSIPLQSPVSRGNCCCWCLAQCTQVLGCEFCWNRTPRWGVWNRNFHFWFRNSSISIGKTLKKSREIRSFIHTLEKWHWNPTTFFSPFLYTPGEFADSAHHQRQ
jgi:hypothetical protein